MFGMPDAGDVVREFHERMQARDWDGAAELLDPSIEIRYTATGERFVGAAFLAMNRAYPDGWTIQVHEVMTSGARVAAQVRVDQGQEIYWCAGFYTVRDGRIVDGVEHWVTACSEPAPPWRHAYTTET
jgi:ketosteroid isomerase-like protein